MLRMIITDCFQNELSTFVDHPRKLEIPCHSAARDISNQYQHNQEQRSPSGNRVPWPHEPGRFRRCHESGEQILENSRVVIWIQIVTGIAVVLGLVLVAFELRQSREFIRIQLAQEALTVAQSEHMQGMAKTLAKPSLPLVPGHQS